MSMRVLTKASCGPSISPRLGLRSPAIRHSIQCIQHSKLLTRSPENDDGLTKGRNFCATWGGRGADIVQISVHCIGSATQVSKCHKPIVNWGGDCGHGFVDLPRGRKTLQRLVALSLLGYAVLALPVYANPPLKAGDVPPDAVGRDSTGKKVKLSDYRDKIVIISFWASWCPSCRQEMSALAAIQRSATRDKLEIFAVNWKENSTKFHAILRALKNVDLTLLSDQDGYFGNEFGVTAIPHMIIIGRDGRIADIHIGYGEGEIPSLVDEINELWTQSSKPAIAPETTAGLPAADLPVTNPIPK